MELWMAALLLILLVASIIAIISLTRNGKKRSWLIPTIVFLSAILLACLVYILVSFFFIMSLSPNSVDNEFALYQMDMEQQDVDDLVDSIESDSGDTEVPNWWGLFVGDGFSIGISNFDGKSFHFEIYLLRNGKTVLDGVAAIYPDDSLMAEYGELTFSLHEEFSVVDIGTSESSEWEHTQGQYFRVD